MDDPLITEYAGTRRGDISRFYQYGSGGVKVLDPRKTVKRLYLFDPSSEIMTECDPLRREKVLRRFVFDQYGMNEETFAFGERPRTFRFEDGGKQIAVREGGDYGAVGKLITFEENGVTETAWGRNGEIERVYQFDGKGDLITIREGGWYGDVSRTIVFSGNRASLFRDPESFLQFFIFSEWSAKDREDRISDRVAQIHSEGAEPVRSPSSATARRSGPAGTARRDTVARPRNAMTGTGIDFIPDSDGPARQGPPMRRSTEISYAERRQGDQDESGEFRRGRSAEIPLDERFGNREPETLSRGRSAEIPLDERFGSREPETLSRGRSAEIPLDERFGSREPGTLSRGRSAEIPLDERFGSREPGTLSRGRSAEIPLDERFGNREPGTLSRGRSAEIPLDERFGNREPEPFSPGKSVESPLDERAASAEKEREEIPKGKSAGVRNTRRRVSRDL